MKAGQKAEVYNGWDAEKDEPILEGIATLKELRKTYVGDDVTELWMVEFDDEPGEVYQRTVFKQHIIESDN